MEKVKKWSTTFKNLRQSKSNLDLSPTSESKEDLNFSSPNTNENLKNSLETDSIIEHKSLTTTEKVDYFKNKIRFTTLFTSAELAKILYNEEENIDYTQVSLIISLP
ncbi:hypothetical protein HDU92_003589 [Lobulomyces angularis]|nr:hypothetical protein HDU92_003589 [Lobulomyces angularis]